MDEIIELKDNIGHYTLDEVDCFQRPVAILLDSFDKIYSDVFIAYAKTLELYTELSPQALRAELMDILEKIDFTVIRRNRQLLGSFIKEQISSGYPVLLGIDYYKLFYSKFYMTSIYPHWILINGYDVQKNLFSVLDYTQFFDRSFNFETFSLTYKILKSISKGYEHSYGKYDSCFSLKISDKTSKRKKLVIDLLDFVTDKINCKKYSIIPLLKMYERISDDYESQDKAQQIKIQILNYQKSRQVFFKSMIDFMYMFNYDDAMTDEFAAQSRALTDEYNNLMNYYFLQIMAGKQPLIKIKPSIEESEERITEKIKAFRQYVSEHDISRGDIQKSHSKIMNDKDSVISERDNNICFDFVRKKEYNWWSTDDAPKYEIVRYGAKNNIEVKAEYEISPITSCENFQIGFYIINGEEAYLAGFDHDDKCCIDKIDIDNYSCFYEYSPSQNIYVNISRNFIEFGTYKGQINKCILKRYFDRNEQISVGLVCKTWGKTGQLNAVFRNLSHKVKK